MTDLAVLGIDLLLWAFGFMAVGGSGARGAHANAASTAGANAAVARRGFPVGASFGCSLDWHVPRPDSFLNVDLGDRRYLLYIPVNYDTARPAPLILSFHGGTRTAETQQALDLLSTTYFNQDYIVVYPNGVDMTWQGTPNVETDDVGFTGAILDQLQSQYCIDRNRIFATGKSQGGGFVGVLACDPGMSTRIAAFAPVSGAFYETDFGATCEPLALALSPCSPGRRDVPVLNFHGLVDDTIAYSGGPRRGGCLPQIPHWCRQWAQMDQLADVNTSSAVPGALGESTAVRYEWGSGKRQGSVTHIMDGTDIGHDWPSTEPNSDNMTPGRRPASFNASSLIIDFFKTHPLTSAVEAYPIPGRR